jgi:hypothetical protein
MLRPGWAAEHHETIAVPELDIHYARRAGHIHTRVGASHQLNERELDPAPEAVADFTDLRSPSWAGHCPLGRYSRRTADCLAGPAVPFELRMTRNVLCSRRFHQLMTVGAIMLAALAGEARDKQAHFLARLLLLRPPGQATGLRSPGGSGRVAACVPLRCSGRSL